MAQKLHFLIIDPQNDFLDIPKAKLPVKGAHADMQRLAGCIKRLRNKISDIHVTLDSHNPIDIGHPGWFINDAGEMPAPLTLMSAQALKDGVWRTRNPAEQAYTTAYFEQVEARGRHTPIVWPEHCLIGTWGHNVQEDLQAELEQWARKKVAVVDYVTKGSNSRTEHYSAVQAEVPLKDDPSTSLNTGLIKTLTEADIIAVSGEALSHCLATTVWDIADEFGEENIRKLVLLTDCTSPVEGFEAMGRKFFDDMVARGMRTATSLDFLA